METATLEYDQMIEEAMRGVVRSALLEVAENGLPGNHHFYISFLTTHRDVEMADYLKDINPEEITIVIQHKYWGLEVGKKNFEVTLSFNKINERLVVPFEAITAFTDPSANFGLQFRSITPQGDTKTDAAPQANGPTAVPAALTSTATSANLPTGEIDLETLRGTGSDGEDIDQAATGPAPAPAAASALKGEGSASADQGSQKDAKDREHSGEVITLDAFRKKTRKT